MTLQVVITCGRGRSVIASALRLAATLIEPRKGLGNQADHYRQGSRRYPR